MQPNWTPIIVELPITADTNAYTAGDTIGGRLSGAVAQLKGGGYISWALLVDDNDQAKSYWLHLFYGQPSSIADDAAYAPTEADKLLRFTTIKIDSANVQQDGADSNIRAAGKDYYTQDYMMFPALSDGNIYGYLVDIDASAPNEANDLTLYLCIMVI
jgi:hypothetical protein